MELESQSIIEKRRVFMNVCESFAMDYVKARLLCNCYINKLTIGSVYHKDIEESLNGINRFMNIYLHEGAESESG